MQNATVQCPICSAGIQVAIEIAGQQIACPTCNNTVQLPSDLAQFEVAGSLPLGSQASTTSICENCRQAIGITEEMRGQQVQCPLCHQLILIEDGPLDDLPAEAQIEFEDERGPLHDDEVDEAELFAPGFHPNSPNIEQPTAADDSSNLAADSVQAASQVQQREQSDSRDQGFSLKLIPHPSLPPVFESTADELVSSTISQAWNDPDQIILPSPTGGIQTIDRHTVGIRSKAGRVVIRATSKEKKEVRSRIRSVIVYAFCAALLIVVMLFLVSLNS